MEPMRLIDEDKDMREGERKGRKDCKGRTVSNVHVHVAYNK